MRKKIIVICCFLLLFSVGCTGKQENGKSVPPSKVDQLAPPEKGEIIAIMKTSMGDIKIKFFPKEAPKAVENFITHAKDGYYDGVTFHRVWQDFMIQGGDPQGTGRGGESIWGEPFEDEFGEHVYHYRGALSMANSGPDTNGSQFFIVQAGPIDPIGVPGLEQSAYDQEVIDNYKKLGGTYHLDYKYTADNGRILGHAVFGHVFEGMDVVDKIVAVPVDAEYKPQKDVIIKSIEIKNNE